MEVTYVSDTEQEQEEEPQQCNQDLQIPQESQDLNQTIPMEIELEDEEQELEIPQPTQEILEIVSQQSLEEYYQSIYQQLNSQSFLNESIRQQYLKHFESSKIQRNQSNSSEFINNLLHKPYFSFISDTLNLPIIKLFIEEQLDYFIWSSKGVQITNDKRIISFAIILKLMRMQNANGQVIYTSIMAYLFHKLSPLFSNSQFELPEFQEFFKYTFWDKSEKLENQNKTPDMKSFRIISVIRKLSALFISLLWIDPNEILSALPQEFSKVLPAYAYTFINQDRRWLVYFIEKFQLTYALVPTLSSLYDIVNQKEILKKIFNKFTFSSETLLSGLGELLPLAHKEFYEFPFIHDKGMVQIVESKRKLLDGQDGSYKYDFYSSLFKNDQNERPEYYSK